MSRVRTALILDSLNGLIQKSKTLSKQTRIKEGSPTIIPGDDSQFKDFQTPTDGSNIVVIPKPIQGNIKRGFQIRLSGFPVYLPGYLMVI